MLDLERIQNAAVHEDPFPYLVVDHTVREESEDALLRDFPEVRHPGSLPVEELRYGPAFDALMADLNGGAFRALVEQKFAIDLADKPTMTTVRGVMRAGRDGRVHTDSRDKLITVLLYFNPDWTEPGGRLRLLRSENLDDYVAEVAPELGTMVIFRVTDNGWHGHLPVEGKRLSIQMNWLSGEAASSKHQFMHRLSARLKRLAG